MSEDAGTVNLDGDGSEVSTGRAGVVRARRWTLFVGAFVVAALAIASWLLFRPVDRPSMLTAEARRQVEVAVLRADAAAAEVVLADVRSEVTGSLRPDEIRARAAEAIYRVRSSVAPLKRSERLPADELEAAIDEVARLLRAGDPAVGEALAALERLTAGAAR